MTNVKPEDKLGVKYNLFPKGVSKLSVPISFSSSINITPFNGNNIGRLYAVGGNVYMKYGTGASLSDFDEIIPDGQVVDITYSTEDIPGPYSVVSDGSAVLYIIIK